ncbi:aminotransferase class V-fold PLP-dependent enzyme [Albimonas sp. CAU 1670]|uniref:aminotransferase class V-fold PLP-dependent enzyme n=1 Tax=Albimonas sp. CAU 1670 TaxID=3032599 RepID=UPI0023DC47CE|nr:aminotransferase class V-fold PLP-dependent enzyme [Albimonas sp. CAU 1670]MDF2233766.1 aminotransferase class V-fold PLP-dependent enzyme [Albimonas sp. CAU 1670]
MTLAHGTPDDAAALPPRPRVYGRALRPLWALREGTAFLNHGSYGAVPWTVAVRQKAHRRRMEAEPDLFFAEMQRRGPGAPLRQVARVFAGLLETPAERLALVENASAGVTAALASAELKPGDEVLISSHQYPAVRLAVAALARRTGAVPVVADVPMPTTPEEAAERLMAAVTPRTRLAVLDHISSASALRWPVEALVPELRARGIATLVDGAHALGHLPARPAAMGADWYVSNAHKWLYAPRGTAVFYASEEAAARLSPPTVSHFLESGFPDAFDYLGTRDYSAWLSAPAGAEFAERMGQEGAALHAAMLLGAAREALGALGAVPVSPLEPGMRMLSFLMPPALVSPDPAEVAVLREGLLAEGIVVYLQPFLGRAILRVSAPPYADAQDVDRLAEALGRRLGARAAV